MHPSLVCVIPISRIAIPDITAPAATEQLRVTDSVKVGEVKGNISPSTSARLSCIGPYGYTSLMTGGVRIGSNTEEMEEMELLEMM